VICIKAVMRLFWRKSLGARTLRRLPLGKTPSREFSQYIRRANGLTYTSTTASEGGLHMDGIAEREMISMRRPMRSDVAQHAIRPEILDAFREGGFRNKDGQEQNYQNAFDRLISAFGRSAEMAVVSWRIASNLAVLIRERDPVGWRWGGETYCDPSLEKAVREFEEFERLFFSRACKLFPIAIQMRDCLPFYDEGLDDLVTALQPFARPRARAADPRSEWHATAKLFAERIEAHFRALSLEPPKRNSVRSPLVLAVQSLLDMVGLRVEGEAIRKVLCQRTAAGRYLEPSLFSPAGRYLNP
jgi:hypothetical protein